jgi:hypothetical protein
VVDSLIFTRSARRFRTEDGIFPVSFDLESQPDTYPTGTSGPCVESHFPGQAPKAKLPFILSDRQTDATNTIIRRGLCQFYQAATYTGMLRDGKIETIWDVVADTQLNASAEG